MTLDEKLLETMLEACERNLVTWTVEEPNYLWRSSEGWTVCLHHVQRGDGESFRDIIEVGAGGVSEHYYRGTVGYALASKLIRFASPDFAKHHTMIKRRLESEIAKIQNDLLKD